MQTPLLSKQAWGVTLLWATEVWWSDSETSVHTLAEITQEAERDTEGVTQARNELRLAEWEITAESYVETVELRNEKYSV